MSVKHYWIGSLFVAEWSPVDTAGEPVIDATVAGEVTQPDATTAVMTITAPGGAGEPYRASFDPTLAGLHAYRLTASGTLEDAREATFVVDPSLIGALPITTDVSTSTGRIRLLISDVDTARPVFADAEINAFYLMGGSNVRLGAAEALDTMASNEAMVSKVIRTLDLQVDGTKVAAELRARAATLRATAADYDNDGNLFCMDVVDFQPERWILGPELSEFHWNH